MKDRMKVLAILGIAAALIFSGCGKQEVAVVETPEEVIEEIEEIAEEEEVVEETEESAVPLRIHIDTKKKDYYFADGENAYLYLQYCDVSVEGDEYEKLKRNIENWSMERSEGLRSLYASFEETANTQVQEGMEFASYSLYQNVSIARADENIVSLLDDTYQYTGGAHGMFYRDGINYDAKTGKHLELADIFYDYEFFVEEAKERIVYELRENYGDELFDDYIMTVESLWNDELQLQWYLDASGIVIVLQEYAVGPYSIGTPEIHLPYAEFESYIKEAYLPGSGAGIASFEANEEVFLQLPKTGEEISVLLSCDWNDELAETSLWLGNQEMRITDYMVITNSYIVRTAEDVYCLVEADMASDDYVTVIYRLSDGVIEKVTEIAAAIDPGNINSDSVFMEFWVNVLGTYKGVKNYHFDENGEFVTEDTEFQLSKNEFVLQTTTELPILLEEEENVLPAGSRIVLNATDGESYVKFTIQETGQTGMFFISRDDAKYGQIVIDGRNENDCFDSLPYAG